MVGSSQLYGVINSWYGVGKTRKSFGLYWEINCLLVVRGCLCGAVRCGDLKVDLKANANHWRWLHNINNNKQNSNMLFGAKSNICETIAFVANPLRTTTGVRFSPSIRSCVRPRPLGWQRRFAEVVSLEPFRRNI